MRASMKMKTTAVRSVATWYGKDCCLQSRIRSCGKLGWSAIMSG
jgi:hypothetical protein